MPSMMASIFAPNLNHPLLQHRKYFLNCSRRTPRRIRATMRGGMRIRRMIF
ncbi:hypothetical protein ANCCAN_21256 [Ancylostoma caninum]|uniref:Uncharacterized protein n=1 Tax=Ancylostoma caninum TaxID=29170 RepID=A0A368FN34_ANCCA|nr:hypothetical protein ANCCAN_21256 [Ancylostoma caninum]